MKRSPSVYGPSPLVLIPGEGTELYRGLGVIVLFGLVGTAIVTLTFLPALIMLALSFSRAGRSVAMSADGALQAGTLPGD